MKTTDEQIKDYLKKHLKVELTEDIRTHSLVDTVTVKLFLDDEEISVSQIKRYKDDE